MTSVTDDTGEAILARALDALTSSPGTATSPDTSMYPDTGIGPATSGRGDFGKALLTSTDSASLADCSPRSLAAEVDTALRSPAIVKRLIELGGTPVGGTPAKLAEFQRAEQEKWGRVIMAAKIRAE